MIKSCLAAFTARSSFSATGRQHHRRAHFLPCHPRGHMAWIRTTPLEGSDEAVARARAMQRELYPSMYGERGPMELADESIVASHTLIPDAQYHAFATFGVLM